MSTAPTPSLASPPSLRFPLVSIISPLNYLLQMSPGGALILSFSVGLFLVLASVFLGISDFHAIVNIHLQQGKLVTGELELGYAKQLNYGPWYVIPFLCPMIFYLCAFIFQATKKRTPENLRQLCNFDSLIHRRNVASIGLIILFIFVVKDIIVEWNDYKNLGLGWVQAEKIEQEGQLAKIKGPVVINRHFYAFLIDRKDFEQADSVQLVQTAPADFHVRSHLLLILFIVIAKAWFGLWESLVIYTSILLSIWAWGVVGAMTAESIKADTDGRLGIAWIQPVIIAGLLLGIEVNIFAVMRFVANAAKGSFGSWEQYWSLLTLTPALILVIAAVAAISKALMVGYLDLSKLFTKVEITLCTFWLGSWAAVAYLVSGFRDSATTAVLGKLAELLSPHHFT